jgi:hypothetical protein
MSFAIFKKSMLGYMKNQDGIKSTNDFAKKITQEYDMCVRRGSQTVNLIPISTPNTKLMETLVNLACQISLGKQKGTHTFADDIGKAVLGYWTGATLVVGIPPIIPAPGSMMNISTTAAMVTSPGTWTPVGSLNPTDDSGLFLDKLIASMQIHVTTIMGLYMTVSMYPGSPPFVAPGVLPWTGFTIPPGIPGVAKIKPSTLPEGSLSLGDLIKLTVDELLELLPDDNNTVEGARAAVLTVGSTEFLSDNGEDAGPQVNQVKAQLAGSLPPPPGVTSTPEGIDDVTPMLGEGEAVECGVGLDYDAQLSPNYKLRDLSIGALFGHKIKAQVGLSVDDIVCNLKAVAENILEPIRAKYGAPNVNSGFRGGPSLPAGRVSQHEKGEAIDIQITGLKPKDYLPVTHWIIANTAFDQIIFEHGNSIWLHITHKRNGGNRKNQLTMLNGNYTSGIKCYYG